MESKAKLLGHPIHQMLIVLPLGLFVMAVACDIIYLITNNAIFATVAFYDISGGIAGGLLAAVFGLIDFLAVPIGTRAKRIGLLHGLGNLAIVLLFAISWLLRLNNAYYVPTTLALIVSFAGALLALATAWLGGELVNRLGVGVDPGANLDAPSSLSTQAPAMPHLQNIPVTGEADHPEPDEP